MIEFLRQLRQRKLVQWSLAYIAAAFAVIQGVDVVAGHFDWPASSMRYLILAFVVGFFVVVAIAWYHGERGAQHVGGAELLIIALLLAVGGGVIGRFAPMTVGGTRAPSGAAQAPADAMDSPPAPGHPTMAVAPPIPAKSIAVLPFENLSSDKENDYFVAGMQDLILTKLADIGDLKVISRTSTMKYASHPEDLKTIGRQLGVATILEGSVQRQGKDVLISVQLVGAATDSHLWAETYRRTLDDVFGVEGEVAGKVAHALNAELSSAAATELATALTENTAANDAYLRAEYFTHRGETNHATAPLRDAIPLYRQALALVPHFALARARLSYTESNLAWFGSGASDARQLRADALANAEQALKLAPNLPEARLAVGYSDYYGKGHFAAALEAFTVALKLRPNDAAALMGTGQVERRLGRFDAALVAFQNASARDPRNTHVAYALGLTYQIISWWPQAEAAYRRALDLDPTNLQAKSGLSNVALLARGDIPEALSAAAGDEPYLRWHRAHLLTYQRRYRDALAVLNDIPGNADVFSAPLPGPKDLQLADAYLLLGDAARARAQYAKGLPPARAWIAATDVVIYKAHLWCVVANAELGLGHTDKALAALVTSRALVAQSGDHVVGPSQTAWIAMVYARAGRADFAVPLLRDALAAPSIGVFYSPVMLWLDPAWDPIREDPRFQALLQKYAKDKPAVIPTAPAVPG